MQIKITSLTLMPHKVEAEENFNLEIFFPQQPIDRDWLTGFLPIK